MKKLFLLTLVMLAIGSTAAFAQTINLGWVGCRTAANDANALLNDVTLTNFPCNANNSSRNLVAAVNTPSYTNFQGASIQLDFITGGGATLPDWWDVGGKIADAGNCRAGGMQRAIVATHSSCANPYGAASQQGGEAFTSGLNGPGTYRLVADHVGVGGVPFVAAGAGGYAAMVIEVRSNGTVDDLDPGVVLCNGCTVPASFVLNHVDFAADGAIRAFDSVANTGLRVCVGWMGGVGGGGTTCPGATPTKNATWGQVKALYR